ncbi:MAG: threonine/serine dehydratase [Acidobacteriota bacterium]|nr:threonine/serine dehydratase [Acidobacteriota bacterium]MDH3524632.1 threonine/serine dehydratase [Acidobacteriota bacterium]
MEPGAPLPPPPALEAIRAARAELGDLVRTTPTWRWRGRRIDELAGAGTEVLLKLELFQHSGTFKARGALLNSLALTPDEIARGVTAVSAGNHAIAVAFAARRLGCSAKVVMTAGANPARVRECRAWGGEVVLARDVHEAFDAVRRIEAEEGRVFIHPFEGERTVLGTATVGLELGEQEAGLDAVVVPIGGGGLAAGVATAIKALQPDCEVFGVEPVGADSMHRSFAAGEPRSIERVDTIADSLGAPHAAPYTFSLCRRFVDELVLVDDDALRAAMRLLFEEAKLVAEPAAAAATAALVGPLRERLRGRRVGLIVCGSNIDVATFGALLG